MLKDIVINALREDLHPAGDVTSQAIFSDEVDNFQLLCKEDGVLSGIEIFKEVFQFIDPQIKTNIFFQDGSRICRNEIIAELSGKTLNILTAERTALNFLSHLSGIASKTAKYVKLADNKIRIKDTRKTIPGLRKLEKYAVRCGGGLNHRSGLYDMVMIKDNHIDAAGSITEAVSKVRSRWKNKFTIEVEARNIVEVKEALACNIDVIMLDNMPVDTMKEAVKLIQHSVEIEISGNVTLDKIPLLKELGINYVSVGALTHSVKALDFSLIKVKDRI